MQTTNLTMYSLWTILFSIIAIEAVADPCGMVPPIYVGQPPVLARVGEQQTYVFYKEGIETFVIRPGFEGDVDNFGMLIPFPTPPAIRKVPDNIFAQIAAAVDPPEVVINLNPPVAFKARGGFGGAVMEQSLMLTEDTVRVIRREAVGMYEVAVLEAGSAAALKKWMDQNGFRYPTGMDAVCEDYVADRWCFVAIKTKVSQKRGVDPVPGQRKVNQNLPAGAVFNGFVQGMGFRFQTEKLVVPMRLSAFNEGELRNIVYLLTDGPKRINSISESTVRRQLTGNAIYRNLTDPLPLRLIGGTEQDLRKWHLEGLAQRRNPDPENGEAKRLFAADLLAARDGMLALPQEETEKRLLAVGEHFGLRGAEIDALHTAFLKKEAEATVQQAVEGIRSMTLTVIDGDFPREVVADQNLTFASYQMPREKNKASTYDTLRRGPVEKQPGIRKEGSVRAGVSWFRALGSFLLGAMGLVCVVKRCGSLRVLLLALVCLSAPLVTAAEPETLPAILDRLADPIQGEGCLDEAAALALENAAQRTQITKALVKQASSDIPLAGRGWTIAALAAIPGQDVDELLLEIQNDPNWPLLVRTWAAAARVDRCGSAAALIEKAALISHFPALGRPISTRLIAKLREEGDRTSVEQLLALTIRLPQLQAALAPMILAQNEAELVRVMRTAKDQNVRRQAAAYLGTRAAGGDAAGVAAAIAEAYHFDPAASGIPWQGGPLFIPGIAWQKDPAQARQLADQLIRWMLWCDRHGRVAEQRQLHNNLRSLNLARAAGYESPGWQVADTIQWLRSWGAVVGRDQLEAILAEQQVAENPRYRAAVTNLKKLK